MAATTVSTKLTLFNTANDKEFRVDRRVPAGKLLAELRAVANRYEKLTTEIIAGTDVPESRSQAETVEFIKRNRSEADKAADAKVIIQNLGDARVLDQARLIVNSTRLTRDEANLVDEPVVEIDEQGNFVRDDAGNAIILWDNFWWQQSMEEVREWVNRFCGSNNIG